MRKWKGIVMRCCEMESVLRKMDSELYLGLVMFV